MSQDKVLDSVLGEIEKKFGKGTIMDLSSNAIDKVPVISTGSLLLDEALGIGGVPRGRITEIYGPESSGKTTLTLHIIAEAQKQGLKCAFIDAEHALDLQYARALGVNTQQLILSQPDSGEDGLEVANMLVSSGAIGLIIVDSVSALTPRAEITGDIGDASIGLQARMMSQALRIMTGNVRKTNTSVIFINQLRMKIGVMFGNPETTSGGNALKFYASIRLDIRGTKAIKKGENAVGKETTVKVVKNKLAPPFKKIKTEITFGQGFDIVGEVIDLSVSFGFLEKKGAWYKLDDENIGQGKENTKEYLKSNIEVLNRLKAEVREKLTPEVVDELQVTGTDN